LALAGLADDIAHVLAEQTALERRETTKDGETHYLVRLSPYRGGDHRTEGAVIAFVDITNITRAEAQQGVLIAELQHRTRNLLTVVQSIAQQSIGKGEPLKQFSARLSALGRVQSLVSRDQSDTVDLGELIRLELETLGARQEGKVRVSGPKLALPFELLQTFGLVVHELTTNALKYGALKQPTGSLSISWEVQQAKPQPLLLFDWSETGVSIPTPPDRKGFGRELIERALAFSAHAKSKLVFGPDGLICHIELPLP
jgi:two-component system CheB/CheR fusion protein